MKKPSDLKKKGSANRIRIRRCSSPDEVSSAIGLASRTLGSDSDYLLKKISNDFKLHMVTPDDVIIAVDNEKVIGTATVFKKELSLFGKKVPASGITYVCIQREYQGAGLGKSLMDYVVSDLKKRSEIISLLFARRAVDGFYNKFGYLGTGYFTELTLDTDSCKNDINIKGIKTVPVAKSSEWRLYMAMYEQTYGDVPFSFVRGESFWKNIDMWLKYRVKPDEFVNVYHNGRLIGYFINKDKRIIEAVCLRRHMSIFNDSMLNLAKKETELVMTFSCYHPCSQYLQKFNHILKFRRAWNGGHMMRIINKKKFYDLIEDYIRTRFLGFFNSKAVSESMNHIKKMLSNLDDNNYYEANKSLFEILNNKSTPIYKEIGNMFEHTWSIIDEY